LSQAPSTDEGNNMLTKTNGVILVLGIILAFFCESVYAQKTVYKWVDENGVVHYGEEPPAGESPDVDVETFTTDPAPAYIPPAQTTVKSHSPSAADVENKPTQPDAPESPPAATMDITKMSLADLERRCEAARQKKIAPLKAAEITKCVQEGTGDQDWCETFASGGFTPPMFHDLPECVDAYEETKRRGLYPDD
jgi:hypothetical protein